jgi:DNA-binding PadR family transcriptional regulator
MLDLAILGLLDQQPLHGYELKKRVGEMLGTLWGISYGSLYPALRRLERDGSIEAVEPGAVRGSTPVPATGSLAGDLAAARARRATKPSRRTRKVYRLTDRGHARLADLLLEEDGGIGDDERTFALKLAFCGNLEPAARLALLQRRRAALADRLVRARRAGDTRGDRYARSLFEHRTQATQRDLEWVDSLIADETRADPRDDTTQADTSPRAHRTEGATAS